MIRDPDTPFQTLFNLCGAFSSIVKVLTRLNRQSFKVNFLLKISIHLQ